MRFHLLNLIIWPRSDAFPPQNVEFKAGTLNVITGASRTGKSAIIPIIDYCLASSDCYIPIDTIRDYSSWYGIIFETENEQVLICRRVPSGNKVSNDFFLMKGKKVSIPVTIAEPNEKTEGVKQLLNTLSFVPYFSIAEEEEKKGYKARLSFRDLIALVFQTQEIVANQNILFYKTHAHEHREKLRNWFPFILGAENVEVLIARQRLQEVERKLQQLRREYDRAKAVSNSWMANMVGHLRVAKEYGLLENVLAIEDTADELLSTAKYVIENIPDHTLASSDTITSANEQIRSLNEEEAVLSSKIAVIKKRLADLANLKTGIVDYSNSIVKRTDRLQIASWLENIGGQSDDCPTCGSKDHPNGKKELQKIASVFKNLEDEAKKVVEIPTSFAREEEKLKTDLSALVEKKTDLQRRFDLVLASDSQAQEEFQQRKNMYLFLGHLKASVETFEKLTDGGELEKQLEDLEREYATLVKSIDPHSIQRRREIAENEIAQGMLGHLKTLDVDEKYRRIAPKFSIEDLNISVLSDDDHWHFLAEVGSASNWVSFHLALMCSLQEHFLRNASSVPSMVIFDQPSQVYFPKLKRGTDGSNLDPSYQSDEDVEAVRSMFVTIVNSIVKEKGAWQAIILDHADSSIYGDIDGVNEVDEWRGGKKLIPDIWIQQA